MPQRLKCWLHGHEGLSWFTHKHNLAEEAEFCNSSAGNVVKDPQTSLASQSSGSNDPQGHWEMTIPHPVSKVKVERN